ncbi:MAG: hypothetical protein EOM50_17235 [Erysipelotrichia bacterium]|nr:hypothetical protein [Erysipelotrichia bacterium]
MKLALGIGSFGQYILNSTKYLNTITEFDTFVITNKFTPNKYTIPTWITDNHGKVLQAFDTWFQTLDFELLASIYAHCVVFIDISESYSTSVFQKILENCSWDVRKKFFVIAVEPLNFEEKSKQLCANEMKHVFETLDVKYQIFCNKNLIDDQTLCDINTRINLFHKTLCDAIPHEM